MSLMGVCDPRVWAPFEAESRFAGARSRWSKASVM